MHEHARFAGVRRRRLSPPSLEVAPDPKAPWTLPVEAGIASVDRWSGERRLASHFPQLLIWPLYLAHLRPSFPTYIGGIVRLSTAMSADPPQLNPRLFVWEEESPGGTSVPTTFQPAVALAPDYLLRLIKCGCSSDKPCKTLRCTCYKSKMGCTICCAWGVQGVCVLICTLLT